MARETRGETREICDRNKRDSKKAKWSILLRAPKQLSQMQAERYPDDLVIKSFQNSFSKGLAIEARLLSMKK